MKARRVLVIGGTGVFGKRLARHLLTFEGIELFISSRTAATAENLVKELKASNPEVPVHGLALDLHKNLQTSLDQIRPFVVVDCSGPFQSANFDAARTILKAGAHLVDLADARDYLANFSGQLDELARAQGVAALTGASSTPALSTCVVDHLTQGWQRVDTIDMCIVPGGKSEVGRSVIEAIMSYAGKQVPIWRDGRLSNVTGWRNARVVDIPDLGRRRVAAVETLDAEYLGPLHKVTSRVSFSAGLESPIEQKGIEAIAALRQRGLLPSPEFLIPMLLKARRLTRIPTSERGGMLVDIRGLDVHGRFTQARWSLVARRDHGPFIPILPAAAALEKLLRGDVPPGASLASNEVALPDILKQMAPYNITTDTDLAHVGRGIFDTRIGAEDFRRLPAMLQDFHHQTALPVWSGKADIEGGRGFIAKSLARLFGFPKAGQNVPVTIRIDRTISRDGKPVERWTRIFAGKPLTSVLRHRTNGSFTENFPPFTFTLPVSSNRDGIEMPVSGWRLGWLPLPRVLAPRSETREYQDEQGRFRFDVRLTVPVVGLLAHYRGWLKPGMEPESEAMNP